MAKATNSVPTPPATELRGWANIAKFLGMPVSTVQRWAKEGLPVTRSGKNVIALPNELNRWLQRTTGEAAGTHVVTSESDLLQDLRASVAAKQPANRGRQANAAHRKGKG